MRKTIFVVLMLGALPLSAAVYKWIDGSGQVHYSDQPSAGASEVELPEAMIYTPPDYRADDETQAESGEPVSGAGYKTLAVVQPGNEETLRSNEGNVAVSIEISPALLKGHRFRLFLDGNQISGELSTPQITLQNVDRGTHNLEVAVVDEAGQEVLRSTSVTFHLRRFSQLLPEPPKPANPIEPPPGDDDGDDDGAGDDDDGAGDDDDGAGDDDDGAGDDDGGAGDDDDGTGDDDSGDGSQRPISQNPYAPNFRPQYNPRAFRPGNNPGAARP